MQYSTNYNMNKPELNEQYRLSHWNDNTDVIDTELKRNADNITSESSRATNAETALQNITNATFKTALLNFCYPIGSLYWSSKSTNPASLFGGTWVQIKDRFVLACGDTYKTVGATGGESSVILSVSNMPSHTHSFTPNGIISGGAYRFAGDAGTTGEMSKNATGKISSISKYGIIDDENIVSFGSMDLNDFSGRRRGDEMGGNSPKTLSIDVSHTHSFTPSGSISVTSNPTFTGSEGTTGSNGSGTAHENMPPYVVKYCWERTA